MKNKHTPGPWSIEISPAGQSSITGEKWCDAVIQPLNIVAERFPAKYEYSANARLIAAAPDLLAALEFCADALNTEAGGLYKAHIEQARAAIYKATQG